MTERTTTAVIERRKSRRRRFREPTEVTLRTTSGSEKWHGLGALFNLSMDGIACRVREEDTPHTAVGRTLRVMFYLKHSSQEFDVTARVISVTRAGSPGHAVIGMEFIGDERLASAKKALRAALEDAN